MCLQWINWVIIRTIHACIFYICNTQLLNKTTTLRRLHRSYARHIWYKQCCELKLSTILLNTHIVNSILHTRLSLTLESTILYLRINCVKWVNFGIYDYTMGFWCCVKKNIVSKIVILNISFKKWNKKTKINSHIKCSINVLRWLSFLFMSKVIRCLLSGKKLPK